MANLRVHFLLIALAGAVAAFGAPAWGGPPSQDCATAVEGLARRLEGKGAKSPAVDPYAATGHEAPPLKSNVSSIGPQHKVNECCSSFPPGANPKPNEPKFSFTADTDPYYSGRIKTPASKPPGYSFPANAPAEAVSSGGVKKVGSFTASFPARAPGEDVLAYYRRMLDSKTDLGFRFPNGSPIPASSLEKVSIGSGGTSGVYLVYPKPETLGVTEAQLKSLYGGSLTPRQLEEAWIRDHGQIIKFRDPNPWGLGQDGAASVLRRDLALQELGTNLAGKAQYQGRNFIQFAPYDTGKMAEVGQGMLRQKPVSGGTKVYDLAKTLRDAKAGDMGAKQAILGMNFSSLEDAEKQVAALEQWYRDSHDAVVAYQEKNGMPVLGNTLRGPGGDVIGTQSIGFDYNHGQNVIWDPHDKMFKVIDW